VFVWNPERPYEVMLLSNSFCYHKRVAENEHMDIISLDVESMEVIFDDIQKQVMAKAEREFDEQEEKRRKTEREKQIADYLATQIHQSQLRKRIRSKK
jgi:hypothetical protein